MGHSRHAAGETAQTHTFGVMFLDVLAFPLNMDNPESLAKPGLLVILGNLHKGKPQGIYGGPVGLVQNSGPSKCAGSLFSFPLEPTAKGHSFGFPLNNQKGVHHFEKHPCNLVAPSGPLSCERLLGFSGIRETFNGGDFQRI